MSRPRKRVWLTRRGLLAAALGLAAGPARAAPPDTNQPVVRISRLEAQYQNTPKGLFSCAACTFFVKPTSCKVVTGAISPNGWCRLFDLPD
jgi:hypothetical protein